MKNTVFTFFTLFMALTGLNAQEDPYIWLEEVDGDRPMAFVSEQNQKTFDHLSQSEYYQEAYDKYLEIANATDRIIYPSIRGEYIYNFWRDKDHVRGIWRRTPKEAYMKGELDWEVLLDLDKLSEEDGVKWVYKGASALYPDYNRFLVSLSKGGGDATIYREFDADRKEFIADGFYLPESKGGAGYLDENTLIVSTDFGANTMTTSGYPRQVKLWKRGTPLSEAELIFEGETTDVSSGGSVMRDGDKEYLMIRRGVTFYTRQNFVYQDGKLIRLDIPEDASMRGILNNQLIVDLNSDWTVNGKTFRQGSLISLNFTDLLQGRKNVYLIVEPDEFSSVSGLSYTENYLLINILKDVTGNLFVYQFEDGKWTNRKVDAPAYGTIGITGTDEFSDDFFFTFSNFLTPVTLYKASAVDLKFEEFSSLPGYFDADKYQVEQFKVASEDGTLIPYFMISSKSLKKDGNNPTLIRAYGGFEVSRRPYYSGISGAIWLDNGGVLVLANIRGGGEYGPKWHQAGLKEKRQNIYNDLYAVSQDVIDRKVTSPDHLGVQGGSNGGLLVGVAFTQRPDLYNAIVCQVPLLDMKRYNKLLAGASWMGEYGNPDIPEEWAYISKYSPYQNLKKGMDYPKVFFYTSTRDDRVHPGHARKMAAKMMDMGYPLYYYENIEGGHSGASTNEQSARSTAMTYAYLFEQLK